jgi:hypothetical protein
MVSLDNCLESQYLGKEYFKNTTNDLTSYTNKKLLKKHHIGGVFSKVSYLYKLVISLCGGMILCLLPILHTTNHSCYASHKLQGKRNITLSLIKQAL